MVPPEGSAEVKHELVAESHDATQDAQADGEDHQRHRQTYGLLRIQLHHCQGNVIHC
jgi:hypothetical protein